MEEQEILSEQAKAREYDEMQRRAIKQERQKQLSQAYEESI